MPFSRESLLRTWPLGLKLLEITSHNNHQSTVGAAWPSLPGTLPFFRGHRDGRTDRMTDRITERAERRWRKDNLTVNYHIFREHLDKQFKMQDNHIFQN